jgi:hypothetical protein
MALYFSAVPKERFRNKTKKWYIFFPVNELVDSGLKFFFDKKISTHCQLIHSPNTSMRKHRIFTAKYETGLCTTSSLLEAVAQA